MIRFGIRNLSLTAAVLLTMAQNTTFAQSNPCAGVSDSGIAYSNPALFEVPANAAEVPPSERLLGPTKECKGCDEHALERLRKFDEEYRRLAVKPQ